MNFNNIQIIHNLDLKVIEQRKMLDLLKYDKRNKKKRLAELEKEYEHLLIESTKGELVKSKISSRAKKVKKHSLLPIPMVIFTMKVLEL